MAGNAKTTLRNIRFNGACGLHRAGRSGAAFLSLFCAPAFLNARPRIRGELRENNPGFTST